MEIEVRRRFLNDALLDLPSLEDDVQAFLHGTADALGSNAMLLIVGELAAAPIFADIQQPLQPTFAGCFSDPQTGRASTGYTHDAQCVTYTGPDVEHQGKEICFGANETALSIADVTDKLMDLNKKNMEIKSDPKKEEQKAITNNNVFIGSTTDLQRLLQQHDEKVIDVSDQDE